MNMTNERQIESRAAKALDAHYHLSTCGNCGAHSADLEFLSGWGFAACPPCADDCRATDALEALLDEGIAPAVAAARRLIERGAA